MVDQEQSIGHGSEPEAKSEGKLSTSDKVLGISIGTSLPATAIFPPVGVALGAVGLSILGFRGVRAGYRVVRDHLPHRDNRV